MENQNGNHWERPTIQNNFYGNIGQQINHVDKIEAHFDKNMGIEVDGQDILKDMAQASSQDEDWIGEILLCFMGDKANALEFVRLARMLKPAQITNLVNAWLVEKKISYISYNRDLWKPLHNHGIYPCTESCWNSQVHLPW